MRPTPALMSWWLRVRGRQYQVDLPVTPEGWAMFGDWTARMLVELEIAPGEPLELRRAY